MPKRRGRRVKKRGSGFLVTLLILIGLVAAGYIWYTSASPDNPLLSYVRDLVGQGIGLLQQGQEEGEATQTQEEGSESGQLSPATEEETPETAPGEEETSVVESIEPTTQQQESVQETATPAQPVQDITIPIYFSDAQGHLVGEERLLSGDNKVALAMQELVKGPQSADHYPTIPPGTKLLGAWVEDGVAYVNFSQELIDKHWGGDTDEVLTVYSIVNTATEIEGIVAVQILVEGATRSTIAGFSDISQPIGRNETLIGG